MRWMVMDFRGKRYAKTIDSIMANKTKFQMCLHVVVIDSDCIRKYVYLMGLISSLHFRNDCNSMQFCFAFTDTSHIPHPQFQKKTMNFIWTLSDIKIKWLNHATKHVPIVFWVMNIFTHHPKRTTIYFRLCIGSQFYCG